MCLRPLYLIHRCEHCDDLHDLRLHKLIKVPCGKCIECLKKKQNDIMARVLTESERYENLHFVTLTYDDLHLPIASALWFKFVDAETGEAFDYRLDVPQILPEGDFLEYCREYFMGVRASRNARYLLYPLDIFNGFYGENTQFYLTLSPSLNRRDFRLWMKGCRVAYEREFGKALPKFSFVFVGEYGSRSCRPHYHCLFMGLSSSQVHWMCERWKMGYYYYERCKTDRSDKIAVAKYVSKYMSKGKFNCDSVLNGDVEKPRYSTSKYLGQLESFDPLIPYVFAFDMFGAYHPDFLTFADSHKSLTDEQIQALVHEIPKRMCFVIPGTDKYVGLPQSWKYKLFYKKVVKPDKSYRYVPFRIFKIMQETLVSEDMADREREYQVLKASLPADTPDSEICLRLKASREASAFSAEVAGEKTFVRFYTSDAF